VTEHQPKERGTNAALLLVGDGTLTYGEKVKLLKIILNQKLKLYLF
jgi:hypothetical protein